MTDQVYRYHPSAKLFQHSRLEQLPAGPKKGKRPPCLKYRYAGSCKTPLPAERCACGEYRLEAAFGIEPQIVSA